MKGRQRPQGWGVAALVLVMCVAMTGCSIPGGGSVPGDGSVACASWESFESPADAMAAADVVVVTDGPAASAGTTHMFGVSANVHSVHVADVLKGSDVRAGDDLEVTSTPETCTSGGSYPDGDPLDASGTLVLFLSRHADTHALSTVTPAQGVVAATTDGEVPVAWPTP